MSTTPEQNKKIRTPRTDPLILEARRAYQKTDLYAVDKLFAEQTRWQRKLTIATNKLETVRKQIDAKLKDLATPKRSE